MKAIRFLKSVGRLLREMNNSELLQNIKIFMYQLTKHDTSNGDVGTMLSQLCIVVVFLLFCCFCAAFFIKLFIIKHFKNSDNEWGPCLITLWLGVFGFSTSAYAFSLTNLLTDSFFAYWLIIIVVGIGLMYHFKTPIVRMATTIVLSTVVDASILLLAIYLECFPS